MLDQPTNERRLTIARAMAEAMQQEMSRDPTVFVMGEDIAGFGGIFGNTRGLFEEFGKERVRDTPISETGFISAAVSAKVGELNLKPLTSALTAALMNPLVGKGGVNMVSAPIVARERGVKIAETRKDEQGAYGSYMRLIVTTEKQTRSVAGTVFSDGKPRFIQIKGIGLEAEPLDFMLYTTNADTPGYIGALGTKLGDLGVNIATFALGRSVKDGEAIALIGVDQELSEATLTEIRALPQVKQAKALKF